MDSRQDDIIAIEDALVTHWRIFGLYPSAEQHDENGVLWNESPIAHLPYNGVWRSAIRENAEVVVAQVCARFRARNVPFLWVIRPSDTPADLNHLLARQGLDKVEEPTGMALDLLGDVEAGPATEATIVTVGTDDKRLTDYEELIRTYWSVPEQDRDTLRVINRYWTGPRTQGERLVAYLNGRPVGKLFLNLTSVPDHASVYGVAVQPEARGAGIASAMMRVALGMARQAGARRMVLHSSNMARGLYERLGFVARCTFPVYATGPIFGTHHH